MFSFILMYKQNFCKGQIIFVYFVHFAHQMLSALAGIFHMHLVASSQSVFLLYWNITE